MWWTIVRLEYYFALTVLARNSQKLISCEIKVYYSIKADYVRDMIGHISNLQCLSFRLHSLDALMWWTIVRLEYYFALTVLARNSQKLISCEIKVYYSIKADYVRDMIGHISNLQCLSFRLHPLDAQYNLEIETPMEIRFVNLTTQAYSYHVCDVVIT